MFGPNPKFDLVKHFSKNVSHRDAEFSKTYRLCKNTIQNKFGFTNHDIIFVVGPATLSMEIVISSLEKGVCFKGVEGKFRSRWNEIAKNHGKFDDSNRPANTGIVRLETSNSTFNFGNSDIIDCVSSFPFQQEDNPKVAIFCMNKLLGSIAGLSVIVVRKDCWNMFSKRDSYSYLDIFLHKQYSEIDQTPCTSPVYSFQLALKCLLNHDIEKQRRRIISNSRLISSAAGSALIGCSSSPVLTLKKAAFDTQRLADFELYGMNSSSDVFQIFTYSESDESYQKLYERLSC